MIKSGKFIGLFFVLHCLVAPISNAQSIALSGEEAAQFSLPGDVALIQQLYLDSNGLVYERYQQIIEETNAAVLGGQLTVYKDVTGTVVTVVGAHFPNVQPKHAINVTASEARRRAGQDLGVTATRGGELKLNPENGRYFYVIETNLGTSRWIHWIDGSSGRIANKFNALTDGYGYGTHYTEDNTDVKDLTDLTTAVNGAYAMVSANGRVETHNQGSTNRPFLGPVATDDNDSWVTIGRTSPGQQALVDAHYYANLTDEYLRNILGFDLLEAGNLPYIEVQAHFFKNYVNAFWNGNYVAFGDGDGINYAEFTSLDVVAHEITHGVTEFTSNLIYQGESGALNEAFSDMMGVALEYYAASTGKEPATSLSPDFFVGEDFDLRNDVVPGIRNMEDPGEDGDPSHYADRYTGTSDNGGVHINSGIANHWFYLLVNGGLNADPNYASGEAVQGVGLATATDIAFLGFTALAENADYCDARAATLVVAGDYADAVADAWDEVGVYDSCDAPPENIAPTAGFSYQVNGLNVNFTDQSTDIDGTLASHFWAFGDGATSSATNPSHDYTTAGTYTVTLTVTDNVGATDSVSESITVSDTPSGSITLTVSPYKVKGVQYADLNWSGASGNVNVYRDGQIILDNSSDSSYTDNIGNKGGGTYLYEVCEVVEGGNCSNTTTADF